MPGAQQKHLVTIAKGIFICTLAWQASVVVKNSRPDPFSPIFPVEGVGSKTEKGKESK
jgi:hypothetical protein